MTITSITVSSRQAATVGGAPLPSAIAIAAPYASAGPLVSGTSNTSATINVLQREYTINETHRSFAVGMRVRASVIGQTGVFVEGLVDNFDGHILRMTPDFVGGAGTWATWQINVAGQPGVQGIQGPVGPQGPIGVTGNTGAQGIPGAGIDYAMTNGKMVVTAASGALTIALKTLAGTDPTTLNPITINFHDSISGALQSVQVTAATLIVIPSGATMGATANSALRLWVFATYDGSTPVKLAVYNALSGFGGNPNIITWEERNRAILGIDASADFAQTFYASAAIGSAVLKCIGFIEWNSSGIVTPGTWTITNLNINRPMHAGVAIPGQVIQCKEITSTGSYSTTGGAGTTPVNIAALSMSFTPLHACNLIRYTLFGNLRQVIGGGLAIAIPTRNGSAFPAGGNTVYVSADSGGITVPVFLRAYDMPNIASATVYSANIYNSSDGAQATWNGVFGVCDLCIEEIQG